MWHAASLWEAHAQFEFCQALESNLNSSANQWGILSSANPMYWKVMSWSFCIPFPLDLNRKPDTDKNSEKKYEYEPVLPGYTQKNGGNSPRTCLVFTPEVTTPPSEVITAYRSAFSMRSSTALFMLPSQLCSALIRHVSIFWTSNMWRHTKKTPGWCTCGFSVHEVYNIIHLAVWPYPSYG